jgi:hypothetical protein
MYREYKFRVGAHCVDKVLAVLLAQFRDSDPYPLGMVDTVYFENDLMDSYRLCTSGDRKVKFRARGYTEGRIQQLQVKLKNGGNINKLKCDIAPRGMLDAHESFLGLLDELPADQDEAAHIRALATPWGVLRPCLRVRYERHRFRIRDERITLDTKIRFDGMGSSFLGLRTQAVSEDSVLEIKTYRSRPVLPLLGVVALQPRGLSKFEEGLERLGFGLEKEVSWI